MSSPVWTMERRALVTDLWNAGVAAEDIGKRLGVTRNAVYSFVKSIGLHRRTQGERDELSQAAAKQHAIDVNERVLEALWRAYPKGPPSYKGGLGPVLITYGGATAPAMDGRGAA